MPRFIETIRPTSFGYYDSDPLFQTEADAFVTFVLRRLGEEILGVELSKKMIWSNLEEATMALNGLLIEYQAKSNLASLLGAPTGSFDPNTGLSNINLSNIYVQQNLSFLNDLSSPYASMIGYGFANESYSGSITMEEGRQDYDLYTELKNQNGIPLYDLQPSGSKDRLQVYDVYHFAPVQYVFNSNLASNFIASGLPVESYIPDTRFYVLPLFEDVLRAGMLEASQRIRRSHFSYRISGKNIRIFPTPRGLVSGLNDKLWIRVGYRQSPTPSIASTIVTSGSSVGNAGAYVSEPLYGANSPFNIPYGPIAYKNLNLWARNWIFQYGLGISKEQLGGIRSKFKDMPIADTSLKLNGDDLVTQGREDKDKLLTTMKETLEALSYDKLAEKEATKAEQMVKQLSYVPVPPSWAIRMG
jgi:hypothetical protein